MNIPSVVELSTLYKTSIKDASLEEIISLLEIIAAENKTYTLIKFDGERSSKRFTTIFNSIELAPHIIRHDADSPEERVSAMVEDLVNLKKSEIIR